MLGFLLYITLGVAFIIFLDHVLITPGHNEQRKKYGATPEAKEPLASFYTNVSSMSDKTCAIVYAVTLVVVIWVVLGSLHHN